MEKDSGSFLLAHGFACAPICQIASCTLAHDLLVSQSIQHIYQSKAILFQSFDQWGKENYGVAFHISQCNHEKVDKTSEGFLLAHYLPTPQFDTLINPWIFVSIHIVAYIG